MTSNFDMWCIVELMGHNRIAGKVTEQTIAGAAMLRVDVPKTEKKDAFTKFYSSTAVYAITPTDESTATKAAIAFDEAPIQEYILRLHSPLLTDKVQRDVIDADEFQYDPAEDLGVYPNEPEDDDEDDEDEVEIDADKGDAVRWAKKLIESGDFVVLDTETTGLNRDKDDEPVQIAVIAANGTVLIDTLVKPTVEIDAGATAVHGITKEQLETAPVFSEIMGKLREAIGAKTVVVYNASYDKCIVGNVAGLEWVNKYDWQCAMLNYADFYGDWNDYRSSNRWQSLQNACAQQSIKDIDAPMHSALGDCLRTLAIIKKMAIAAG